MKLLDFDYELPPALIAQEPKDKRDSSRLMVVTKQDNSIKHSTSFCNITEHLSSGDVLVLNDTKVVSAKLIGQRKTGGKVDMLVIKQNGKIATAMIQVRKRPEIDEIYYFDDYQARVLERVDLGWKLEFNENVTEVIKKLGYPPLPPYIKRKGEKLQELSRQDKKKYQTVYAAHPGAIAAPTAGLHFTPELLKKIEGQGVKVVYVTLHVGTATFLPIKSELVHEHKMGSEHFHIPQKTADTINEAKNIGKRVIAVGTTSCRALESSVKDGRIEAGEGSTDIYIYPGYKFCAISGLVTNFHLPKSTLILLVSALAGRDLIFQAYQEAIKSEYKFYSYGDSMLIL